jgi:hypothetical protein
MSTSPDQGFWWRHSVKIEIFLSLLTFAVAVEPMTYLISFVLGFTAYFDWLDGRPLA